MHTVALTTVSIQFGPNVAAGAMCCLSDLSTRGSQCLPVSPCSQWRKRERVRQSLKRAQQKCADESNESAVKRKNQTKIQREKKMVRSVRCVIRTVGGEWTVCVCARVLPLRLTEHPFPWFSLRRYIFWMAENMYYIQCNRFGLVWLDFVWSSSVRISSVLFIHTATHRGWTDGGYCCIMCFSHYFPHFVCLLIQCNAIHLQLAEFFRCCCEILLLFHLKWI